MNIIYNIYEYNIHKWSGIYWQYLSIQNIVQPLDSFLNPTSCNSSIFLPKCEKLNNSAVLILPPKDGEFGVLYMSSSVYAISDDYGLC